MVVLLVVVSPFLVAFAAITANVEVAALTEPSVRGLAIWMPTFDALVIWLIVVNLVVLVRTRAGRNGSMTQRPPMSLGDRRWISIGSRTGAGILALVSVGVAVRATIVPPQDRLLSGIPEAVMAVLGVWFAVTVYRTSSAYLR
jgi:hypothetical protein